MSVYRSVVGGGTPNIVPIKITSSHVFFTFPLHWKDSQRSSEAGKSSASWPLNKPWVQRTRERNDISYKLFIQKKYGLFGRVAFDFFLSISFLFFFRAGKKKKDQFLFLVGEDVFIQLLKDDIPSLAFIQNSNESSNQLKIRKFGSGRQKKENSLKKMIYKRDFEKLLRLLTVIVKSFRISCCED